MSQARKTLITAAFHKLDRVSDGNITVEDLKGVYNVKKHPKFLSGEWNEDKCLREFLDSFDAPDNKDGVVCSFITGAQCYSAVNNLQALYYALYPYC